MAFPVHRAILHLYSTNKTNIAFHLSPCMDSVIVRKRQTLMPPNSVPTFEATILTTFYGTLLPKPLRLTVAYEEKGSRPTFLSGVDEEGNSVDVSLLNQNELRDALRRSLQET